MKRTQLCALILAGGSIFFLLLLLPLRNAGNLYDSVIRIHVLANSDSAPDQARKLAVRDSILSYTGQNLSLGSSQAEARAELENNLDALEQVARETLRSKGCDHNVKITIDEEYYPTREYDTLSLPAGKYLSLRVQIGAAEGKNWWCVLFPPLCLSSSVDTEDALTGAGMEEENAATLVREEKSYRVRFKFLELLGKTKEALGQLF
ncbi:MAG: stage II sporulation protein R [Ruminococcaceae bacterium]|nr:stage II sporulation protein R [Oscillospiraceae bacterium]